MDAATQPQSTTLTRDLHDQFVALLGPDQVRPTTPSDAVSAVQPQLVLEPVNEQQLADALRIANEGGLAVILRGGGTKLGWGNPTARADLDRKSTRLNSSHQSTS